MKKCIACGRVWLTWANARREGEFRRGLTICNVSIEAAARAGMVAPDDKAFAYLQGRPYAPKGANWDTAVTYWGSFAPSFVSGVEVVPFDVVLRTALALLPCESGDRRREILHRDNRLVGAGYLREGISVLDH
jgi:hypothetical protein